MTLSGPRSLLVALAALPLVVSCGNVKFAAGGSDSAVDSVGDSGTQSERTIDEPVDVAGGFGLTCIPAVNPQDASKSDFGCKVADAGGQKFIDRPGLKLDFLVELRGQMVQVTKLTGSAMGFFMFTVAKSDMSQVKVAANFVNPQDGNKVVGALKKDLPETIIPADSSSGWSRYSKTMLDGSTGLLWAGMDLPKKNYHEAKSYCSEADNFGGFGTGHKGWRLPTIEELNQAYNRDLKLGAGYPFPSKDEGWLNPGGSSIAMAVWSSTFYLGRVRIKSLDPRITTPDTYDATAEAFAICVR